MHVTIGRPRVTGDPGRWAAEMAVLGAGSAAIVCGLLATFVPPAFLLAAPMTAGLTGGLLGAAAPFLLEAARRRGAPFWLVAAAGPLVGAGWGAAAGAAASVALLLDGQAELAALGVGVSAAAAAAQVAWWWPPYIVQTVRGGPRWPITVAAAFACVPVALVAFSAAIALTGV